MSARKVITQAKQTIWDIAMQEYGSVEQVFQLMADNPEVVPNLATNLAAGQLTVIRNPPVNSPVLDYMKRNKIKPVSDALHDPNLAGDFNDDYNDDYLN